MATGATSMETMSVPVGESGAESSSRVKDDGGATPPGGGRGSPPPNCAICLGQCQNKSFTNSCMHQFCFNCLLTWSKIKAECPLCKQNFKSIIHTVRSNYQYEEYRIAEQREAEALILEEPRFRYRTTITIPRREGPALQRLLLGSTAVSNVLNPPRTDSFRRRYGFRRTVYRHNLWSRPLPDFTGRLRECSPEFYRENEAQRIRLVQWITRELTVVLDENHGQVAYVLARILDLLPVFRINSPEFMAAMLPFFGEHTEHFLHELYNFASTPYDILGYDRNVQYGVDPRMTAQVNEVISSSDSDSVDSDIVMVSSSQPAFPVPLRVATPPLETLAGPSAPGPAMDNVISIETISHSESEDSSSEVIMVGYIKPPQDRTPEIVDLLASDSDVLVQENSPSASTSRDVPQLSASALVKLTLSRRQLPDSDSDDYTVQPRPKRKKRFRTHSATTTSTRQGTPSPTDMTWNPSDATAGGSSSSGNSDESFMPSRINNDVGRSEARSTRKRSNTSKDSKSRRHRRKLKKKRARSRTPSSPSWTPPLDLQKRRTKEKSSTSKSRKHKSRSGKGVKSSKRRRSVEDRPQVEDRDQPGTSGTQGEPRRREEQDKARVHGERKKLKSVVCTLPISSFSGRSQPDATSQSSSTSETSHPTIEHTIDRILGTTRATSSIDMGEHNLPDAAEGISDSSMIHTVRKKKIRCIPTSSDSDDDIPLNLTVKK